MPLKRKSLLFNVSKNKDQSGFTLIELLIAALLISGIVAGLLGSLVTAGKLITPQVNVAQNLARAQMEHFQEYVRRDSYGDANSTAVTSVGTSGNLLRLPDVFGQNSTAVITTVDGTDYTMTYKVTPICNTAQTANLRPYRRVQVDVSW